VQKKIGVDKGQKNGNWPCQMPAKAPVKRFPFWNKSKMKKALSREKNRLLKNTALEVCEYAAASAREKRQALFKNSLALQHNCPPNLSIRQNRLARRDEKQKAMGHGRGSRRAKALSLQFPLPGSAHRKETQRLLCFPKGLLSARTVRSPTSEEALARDCRAGYR